MHTDVAINMLNECESDLKIGDKGEVVEALQMILESMHPDLYLGKIDGDFGPMTETGVMRFQQFRLLKEDGIVGPITKGTLLIALNEMWSPGVVFQHPSINISVYGCHHPRLGDIPDAALGSVEAGKISHFGGPNDAHDRIYGQAYIGSRGTPKRLWECESLLARMGILRSEIATVNEWPMTTDWKGRERRAGTSWALNPDSYYIAMRWRIAGRSMGYTGSNNPRLLVWSEKTNKAVICLRTDYGPHPRAGRLMDLSPGALKHLNLKTDDVARVCWANSAEIGPVKW